MNKFRKLGVIFVLSIIVMAFDAAGSGFSGRGPSQNNDMDSKESIDKLEDKIADLENLKKKYSNANVPIISTAIDRALRAYKDYKDAKDFRNKTEMKKAYKEVKSATTNLNSLLPKDEHIEDTNTASTPKASNSKTSGTKTSSSTKTLSN